jgi:hypothetical protein
VSLISIAMLPGCPSAFFHCAMSELLRSAVFENQFSNLVAI